MTHYGQEVRDAFFLSELIELDSSSKNGLLYTVLSNSKKEKKKQCLVKHETKPDPDGKKKTIGNRKSDLPQKKKGGLFFSGVFFFLFYSSRRLLCSSTKVIAIMILHTLSFLVIRWMMNYSLCWTFSLSLSLSAVGHFTLYSKLINTSSSSR